MFFDTAADVGRVLAMGAMTYGLVVVVLRLSGKRTLASLNAFDVVVSVALGSILATALLSTSVSLADAAAAFIVLVVAQYVVAWLSARSSGFRRITKSRPTLLLRNGRMLDENMRRSRVSPDEVRQAIRSSSQGGLELVAAVVLETDGTLSVIPQASLGSANLLDGFSS